MFVLCMAALDRTFCHPTDGCGVDSANHENGRARSGGSVLLASMGRL